MSYSYGPDEFEFVPQEEPLYVGLRYNCDAVSGRVMGYQWKEREQRGRILVLVTKFEGQPTGPVLSLDGGHPCRFFRSQDEAWAAAQGIAREWRAELNAALEQEYRAMLGHTEGN